MGDEPLNLEQEEAMQRPDEREPYGMVINEIQLLLLFPLLVLCAALVVLETYLIIRAIIRIRRQDRHILAIKRRHSRIAEFID